MAAVSLNTLYQFWIHTELVGSLGPLEKVLNTPSHHRVHHARNPGYLDRNYAAVFIVWDRLFGTFAPEREPPDYGITRPLRSFNALWAQVQPFAELTALSRSAPTWRDRLAVWLAPPERSFAWQPAPAPARARRRNTTSPFAGGLRRYVLVNFALAVAATFLPDALEQQPAGPAAGGQCGAGAGHGVTAGGLMEGAAGPARWRPPGSRRWLPFRPGRCRASGESRSPTGPDRHTAGHAGAVKTRPAIGVNEWQPRKVIDEQRAAGAPTQEAFGPSCVVCQRRVCCVHC